MNKFVGLALYLFIFLSLSGCNKPVLDEVYVKTINDSTINDNPLKSTDIKPHSLWLVQSNGERQIVGTLIEGLIDPLISPDKNKILFVKVTESSGDALWGFPVIYDIKQKTIIKELPPERSVLGWNAGWFTDSNAVLMNGDSLLNLDTWETIVLEGQNKNLGGKPSPDGSKIAVFNNQSSTVNPLKITIYDNHGIAQKTIETSLYPRIDGNLDMPMPVSFQWYNNQSIILESWNERGDTCDIYLLDTLTGETYKLIENGYNPVFSPGTDKIAVIGIKTDGPGVSNNQNSLKIYNPKGDLLSQHTFETDLYIYSLDWTNEGPDLYIKARFLDNNGAMKNGVIIWNGVDIKDKKVIEIPSDKVFLGVSSDGESLYMYDNPFP